MLPGIPDSVLVHHRDIDQAGDEAGQHAIHARGDDDHVGPPLENGCQRPDEAMKAGHTEVGLEPGLEPAPIDHHSCLVRNLHVRRARSKEADLAGQRLRMEPGAEDACRL